MLDYLHSSGGQEEGGGDRASALIRSLAFELASSAAIDSKEFFEALEFYTVLHLHVYV